MIRSASALRATLALFALLSVSAAAACRHPAPAGAEAEKLTVGVVQREIAVGMDAASVAEVLGSPNIVTTDEERREVWIYDRISSESVDTANSIAGSILVLGGATGQRQSSKTQKTLTIIIKYDEQKRVRDFAYNYSQF